MSERMSDGRFEEIDFAVHTGRDTLSQEGQRALLREARRARESEAQLRELLTAAAALMRAHEWNSGDSATSAFKPRSTSPGARGRKFSPS